MGRELAAHAVRPASEPMRHSVFAASLVPLALSIACGESTSAQDTPDARSEQRGIPGYVHVLPHSRFSVGTVIREADEYGMHKIIGTLGTFATEVASQAATAIPNLPVPGVDQQYFPGGYGPQNVEVVSYLTGAGLPADQIVSVSDDQTGLTCIAPAGPPCLQHEVVAWYSILHRGYEGVTIEDSTAWAILDVNGASVEEQVFWPAIAQDVVDEISKFQALLADIGAKNAFLSRLPSDLRDGHLSVHHTSWDWKGTFEARACYHGTLAGAPVCFDASGHLVQVASDGPPA